MDPNFGRNLKILIYLVLFTAWGFLVGFSKAVILFTGKSSNEADYFLECTYFNGFVLKTRDVRELRTVPDDTETCPFIIENSDLDAWTP